MTIIAEYDNTPKNARRRVAIRRQLRCMGLFVAELNSMNLHDLRAQRAAALNTRAEYVPLLRSPGHRLPR